MACEAQACHSHLALGGSRAPWPTRVAQAEFLCEPQQDLVP